MFLDSSAFDKTNLENDILKNYFEIKEEFQDCIVLFQMGTFLEAFFEDAKALAQISGTTLTTRTFAKVGEVACCGFPMASKTTYIKQLLDNKYKICLCEESKDEQNATKRKVQRTYTQGTILENEFLEISENNYISALYLLDSQINFAYADVSTGQLYRTKGSFEEIRLEIEKIEPKEILILKKQEKNFKEIIEKYNVTILNDYFNSTNSEEIIEKYCVYTQKDYCAKLNKKIDYEINNYLIMDEATRKNLELTRNKMHSKKKGSLLWFLNNTKTAMGARLLKKYISEPLLNIEKIKERQNAIEELISKQDLLSQIEKTLENFCDLSRICAKISNSTILPKDLYRIAQNSSALVDLCELSSKLNSKEFILNKDKLNYTLNLTQQIKSAINKEAPNEITKGEIIKNGYDANLDYTKDKLKQLEKQIAQYETREKNRLQVDNLKISNSKIIGYYIEIPNSKIQKIPSEYLKKQALSNVSRYSTEKLCTLEQEIYNLKYKINEYEYKLFCDLREKAKDFIETIRSLAHEIAKIDVLASLAKCAIVNNFVKPTFNTTGIEITNGYHPSLLKLKNEIIKNDTHLENGSMMVLMGANMSGKSTYLKYNAIICLLAQIGSFIPADSADLILIDKLFLRQGSTDDIISNNSSFMVEMNDLKFILDNITNSSFILLDEPAKSTNAKEGGAIARAFCDYILKNYKNKTIIATHNLELTKLENDYPNKVYNYTIGEANETNANINNRKIKRGISNTSNALNTAMLANLPEEIICLAKKYVNI